MDVLRYEVGGGHEWVRGDNDYFINDVNLEDRQWQELVIKHNGWK